MTKRQKEITILGFVVALIAIVLVVMFAPKAEVPAGTVFVPKTVDVKIEPRVLQHPEYRELSQPNVIPVRPVETGRDNPFIPF